MQNKGGKKQQTSWTLMFLSMMYAVIMLCPGTIASKLVDIHGVLFAAGSLILPLLFWIGCIITEVYGYSAYRRVTWFAISGQFFYTFSLWALTKLPSPEYWHHQEAYDFVIGQLPKMFTAHFIFIPICAFVNSYIISKWKILASGKRFGVRSVTSSIAGEFLYAILICLVVFYGTLPFSKIAITMVVSFSLKVIYTFLLAYPAVLIAEFIKSKEKIDVYDYDINYNPFVLEDKETAEQNS